MEDKNEVISLSKLAFDVLFKEVIVQVKHIHEVIDTMGVINTEKSSLFEKDKTPTSDSSSTTVSRKSKCCSAWYHRLTAFLINTHQDQDRLSLLLRGTTSSYYSSAAVSDLVNRIRKPLQEDLVGAYSRKVVQEFDGIRDKQGVPLNRIVLTADLCFLFLDCVLNDSITEFKMYEGGYRQNGIQDPNKLLQVLIDRSPRIQSLDLNFLFSMRMNQHQEVKFVFNLKTGFTNLTSLSLLWDTTDTNDSILFFTYLGECCPLLTHFAFQSKFSVSNLLALMLGPKHHLFPKSMKIEISDPNTINDLYKLQFPAESLTPLCRSLKKIDCGVYVPAECNRLDSYVRAFAYRHFPQLVALRRYNDNPSGQHVFCGFVHRLYETTKGNKKIIKTSRSSPSLGSIQWTVNSPFTGSVKIVQLDSILIKSRKCMEEVTFLCPNLKKVTFHVNRRYDNEHDELINVQELESLLKKESSCWSKVVDVTFVNISLDYRKIFLAIIGPQLRKLTIFGYDPIDATTDLLPCSELEELNIFTNILPLSSESSSIEKNNFLRCLKVLDSSHCLHNVSHLLETSRSSLTHFSCHSLHIGIPESNSSCTLTDIPKLWPNLETFSINSISKGMTIKHVRQMEYIIPHLQKLNHLMLPLAKEEKKETLEAQFEKFKSKMHVHFSEVHLNNLFHTDCFYP